MKISAYVKQPDATTFNYEKEKVPFLPNSTCSACLAITKQKPLIISRLTKIIEALHQSSMVIPVPLCPGPGKAVKKIATNLLAKQPYLCRMNRI